MPPALAKPARRICLSLWEADCQQLEHRYGRGWSEQVRLMVERNCRAWAAERAIEPVEDILDQIIRDAKEAQ